MTFTNSDIIHVLYLIDAEGNSGLHKKDFGNYQVLEDLIAYLLKEDLVETEDDPNIYFLTDVGYAVVETGTWYDPELNEPSDYNKSRELKYTQVISEEEQIAKEKSGKIIEIPLYLRGAVLSLFVLIGSYFFVNKEDSYDEQLPDIPKNSLLFLQEQLDSISEAYQLMNGTLEEEPDTIGGLQYFGHFNWFEMNGDSSGENRYKKSVIAKKYISKDSFSVYIHDRRIVLDSFLFIRNDKVFVSSRTLLGKKFGTAFDHKREVIFDPKKERLFLLHYSRLKPGKETEWPISRMVLLTPEKYSQYTFPLYQNPPIDTRKLCKSKSISEYINDERLLTLRQIDYYPVLENEKGVYTLRVTRNHDATTGQWNQLAPDTIWAKNTKYVMGEGMHIWRYFLKVFKWHQIERVGYD